MDVLADENVPEEYVAALRDDGHRVVYTRDVEGLGAGASDTEIASFAESTGWAILSTDVKDFAALDAEVATFVAPQDLTGGEVRAAVAHVESLPLDPTTVDTIWLSGI